MASSFLGFFALHLYCQLVLCPAHIVYGLISGLVNPYAVTRHLCQILGIRFLKSKHSKELYVGEKRVIFLCNHRSWADFFVDQAICGGASYLARYMVWIGTPVSSLYGWMTNSTWFFNRKRGIDRVAFSQFMETSWEKRPGFGMIAYPEGTRNQTQNPLPLKTGVLQFAYEYKHPIQVVITTNKEIVYNEKKFEYLHGTGVVTCFGELVDPEAFATQEEFVLKCRESFATTWKLAHEDENEATEYEPPMGREQPGYMPPSEPYKANLLRLAAFLLCVFFFTTTASSSAVARDDATTTTAFQQDMGI